MPGANRVLLTDGYAAYEKYAKKLEITHAQCWVHCRRGFFEALQADQEAVEEALKRIAALYKIEDQIREQNLVGERKRQHRLTHSKPRVESFFDWIDKQFERQGLLPSNPFTQALGYARERRLGLEVFLEDPDVAMGRVSDWRDKHTLRGVTVCRQSRCLSPRRMFRLQSLLIEPDLQNYRIRLSRMSLRPSHSPQMIDAWEAYTGRASHRDTRLDIGSIRCLASHVVASSIAAGATRCSPGLPYRPG